MASISETGHIKNVANFEDLISFCTSYGINYNPSRTALQLPALSTLHTTARNAVVDLNTAKSAFIQATNARQIAFDSLKKLATRIINALAAAGVPQNLLKDAKTINAKIQGKRADQKTPEPIPPDGEAPQDKTISVSQQSYDSLIENLDRLIQLLAAEPAYNPNETDLQTATLQNYLSQLRAANTSVTNTYTAYSSARISRNNILYGPQTGLVNIAADVKKYVKSVFGTASPRYKQISALQFTKPKE
jgi:hypothetical protein